MIQLYVKKYIKWGGIVLASPFILFIVLCILIYIPAIQNFIVDKAMEYKLGARGLRSICEAIMLDAMFEVPSETGITELVITLDYAVEKFEKADFKKLKAA